MALAVHCGLNRIPEKSKYNGFAEVDIFCWETTILPKLSRSASEVQRGLSSSIPSSKSLPSPLRERWKDTISPTTCPDFHEEGAAEEVTTYSGWALAGYPGHHRSVQCSAATSAPFLYSHRPNTQYSAGFNRDRIPFAKCLKRILFSFWMCEMKADFSPQISKIAKWICCPISFPSGSKGTTGSKDANKSVPPVSLIFSPQTRVSTPVILQSCVRLLAFIFLLCFNSCFYF